MIKHSRAVARVGTAAVLAAGLAVTLPLTASAHVTITPSGGAVSGGWITGLAIGGLLVGAVGMGLGTASARRNRA